MNKLKAVWELMRLEHGIMIALAILAGALIAQQILPQMDKFLFTFFTALFLEASTFALNDYYDYEIDKKNKRTDRPLVRGDLNRSTALLLFFILFPLGIICSYFVNLTCFLIALITALFAIFYDVVLKKVKLLGNFFIAYVMAIPFVFGAASVLESNMLSLNISPAIITVALIAFLAGSGREIMKDVMDIEGDKKQGVKSFPIIFGIRRSNILSAVLYLGAIAFSFVPFFQEQYSIYYLNSVYLLIVFIADIILLSAVFQLVFKKQPDMKLLRVFTLMGLFVGLLAFLIGAFVG